jgi:hypothetical protein
LYNQVASASAVRASMTTSQMTMTLPLPCRPTTSTPSAIPLPSQLEEPVLLSHAALFLAFSKPPGGDAAHNAHVDAHTTPSEFHAVPVAPNKSALRMQQQYPPPSDVARLPNASQACTNRQARLPFCPEQQMTEERAVTKIFIPRAFDRGRSKFRPPGRCKVPLGAASGTARSRINANLIYCQFRICFPLPRPLVSVSPFLS